MAEATSSPLRAWSWIPTLYFGQGIPYVVVMTVAVVMYKHLGVSNAAIALYTSWLYLPWVVKPLWSPLLELLGTKRRWITGLQFGLGAALALVALALPGPDCFRWTLTVFWLLAFSSATHDIAADGFYLLSLPPHQQAAFVGVRSTFYRLAMITGQGGIVWLAGRLQARLGSFVSAWVAIFWLLAALFLLLALYHAFVLPRPTEVAPAAKPAASPWRDYLPVFAEFFRKPQIGTLLAYLLLYRFAEAQLLKLVTPFLLDPRSAGGLGLSTQAVGIVYGTVGVVALTAGGITGGWLISRYGLKRLLWPMAAAMNVPNLIFVLLAWLQPGNLWVVGSALGVEQFGYGLGFAAYLVYMMMVAAGPHQTAHYAICTGFMAMGMMLPGMPAGWLQEQLGYMNFFAWVCVAMIPSLAVTALIKVDPAFGKKA